MSWANYLFCFDRIFFIALVLALRYDKLAVCIGGLLALLTHAFMAAIGDVVITEGQEKGYINIVAAGLFLVFSGVYIVEWFWAEEFHEAASPRTEAVADLENVRADPEPQNGPLPSEPLFPPPEPQKTRRKKGAAAAATATNIVEETPFMLPDMSPTWPMVVWIAFITTFVGLCGGPAQVRQPMWLAMQGCSVGFSKIILGAVIIADMVQRMGAKERTAVLIAAVSFFAIAAITFKEGVHEIRSVQPYKVSLLQKDLFDSHHPAPAWTHSETLTGWPPKVLADNRSVLAWAEGASTPLDRYAVESYLHARNRAGSMRRPGFGSPVQKLLDLETSNGFTDEPSSFPIKTY